jgi:hypothetical protein
MTVKIHTKLFDEHHVVISNSELNKLIEAVGKTSQIEVELIDDVNGESLMKLCEEGGSFDFLLDEREDIYTLEDLKIRY